MALENKLGLTSSADLAREEERISKKKAVQLYESGRLAQLTPGTVPALQEIHRILFEEIYDFAWPRETSGLLRCSIWNRHSTALSRCPSPPLKRSWKNMWR